MIIRVPPADIELAFERYARDVYGWAYRLLRRHHDAMDVVQEVFLKWQRQCAANPPEHPRGWLRRTTVNQSIDLQRRERRRHEVVSEQMRAEPVASDSPLHLDRAALADDVAAAMGRLTEPQRDVLMAKVYDGLTFAEIAAEQGVAPSTVKTHYVRALRAMHDQLSHRWTGEDVP